MAKIFKCDYTYLELEHTSLRELKEKVDELAVFYGEEASVSYYDTGDNIELKVTYSYEETPEEEAERLAREARSKEQVEAYQLEAYQRKQYEELKKKFEGQSANEGQ